MVLVLERMGEYERLVLIVRELGRDELFLKLSEILTSAPLRRYLLLVYLHLF